MTIDAQLFDTHRHTQRGQGRGGLEVVPALEQMDVGGIRAAGDKGPAYTRA
jgi:hypothetical protein